MWAPWSVRTGAENLTSNENIFVLSFVLCPYFNVLRVLSCALCCLVYKIHNTNIRVPGGIRTRNPSKRSTADARLRPLGQWDRSGPVLRSAENFTTTGIRSPDRPVCSESLYRLRYPGPPTDHVALYKFCYWHGWSVFGGNGEVIYSGIFTLPDTVPDSHIFTRIFIV